MDLDALALGILISGMAFSIVEAGFAAWLALKGLPKQREHIDGRIEAKETELLTLLEAKEAAWQERLEEVPAMLSTALATPETQAAITAAISPAIEAIAPQLIDALISKGAEDSGKRGNMAKSMLKVAAKDGVDLEGLLAGISPEQLQAGLSALQGGGQMPQGMPPNLGGIIQQVIGQGLLGMLPAKYRKMIPPGINPMQLLGGLGGFGGNGGGNAASYSPGIRGRR